MVMVEPICHDRILYRAYKFCSRVGVGIIHSPTECSLGVGGYWDAIRVTWRG